MGGGGGGWGGGGGGLFHECDFKVMGFSMSAISESGLFHECGSDVSD